MKKIFYTHVVTDENDILALNFKLDMLVDAYNHLVAEDKAVKKFTDKATAAKRLFAVLPEAPKGNFGTPRPDSVKTILRKIYTDPQAAYTLDELMTICGCQRKVLCDDMARLKNPKYCGKGGTLEIIKNIPSGKYITAAYDETAATLTEMLEETSETEA